MNEERLKEIREHCDEARWCTCIEDYKRRDREDPQCRHSLFEELTEDTIELANAYESLKRERDELKAEVEGLRATRHRYVDGNAELSREVKRLQREAVVARQALTTPQTMEDTK